jgi:16S rRNA (guanine1207-N2)-methyltransferase
VSLALAARDSTIAVHAIDANARAVECTQAGAALNSLFNVTAELVSADDFRDVGRFDLALANPPYFADFDIAQRFLGAAHRSLRSGGRVLVVAKRPEWYEHAMPTAWDCVESRPSGQYSIVTAIKP